MPRRPCNCMMVGRFAQALRRRRLAPRLLDPYLLGCPPLPATQPRCNRRSLSLPTETMWLTLAFLLKSAAKAAKSWNHAFF